MYDIIFISHFSFRLKLPVMMIVVINVLLFLSCLLPLVLFPFSLFMLRRSCYSIF